ncbi:LysM domain-containing protein [Rubrivivax sp. A210]|uniref:LysM peptidoglycan-binding domain-containing protein n=1 Tax=Rubrivivax sp. A210 TaxID=2772301 RepID=UPI0019185BAA|nr:LysM domain-containing protein [Rubrivivax sp. A210]CAD5372742.1 LysM domain-containing protein [Rubrivivax sp. A210]
MIYSVRQGDSLWRIAAFHFGRAELWPAIAQDNHLRNPDRLLVGQMLSLRDSMLVPRDGHAAPLSGQEAGAGIIQAPVIEHLPSLVPGRGFFFVLADEINPLSQKLVRKVLVHPELAAALSSQVRRPIRTLPNPEKFGLHPTDPLSNLPPGRHAQGMKPSPYSSASTQPLGSSRIVGSRFWIDVEKARAAGATLHGTEEILADLERIAKKTADAASRIKLDGLKKLVRGDGEVLVRGAVPASAIKGSTAMAMTRGLQGVQIAGFVMTAIDMKRATVKSVEQQSVKPVAAETVRQVGGWAAAWAGMKLGAAGGALMGLETGPGALATGAVGGLVGGVAGYYGFDWVADHIDAN